MAARKGAEPLNISYTGTSLAIPWMEYTSIPKGGVNPPVPIQGVQNLNL